MVVSEIMTSNPETADVRQSIRSVIRKLLTLDVRHLPVMEDGELVGIVSDRDLRDVTARLIDEAGAALDRPIGETMSTDVISVDPETEVDDVIDLLIEHRVGAVPVVSPGTRSLVGIVSYADVLRAVRGNEE